MTLPATMRAIRKLTAGEGLGMAEVPVPRPGKKLLKLGDWTMGYATPG